MRSQNRSSSKRKGFSLSKTASHDSCLDQIEETYSYIGDCNDKEIRDSKRNSNRRFTMTFATSRSSLMDISKSNMSGSKRFLAFFQKGFHSSKSKSINKLDNPNFIKIVNERNYLDTLNEVVPIPIRETAIQGNSKTLYHKIPKSNVRAKPLLKLGEETKFVPIHPSLLSKNFHYCVKIMSLSPNVYRNCSSGNKYELLLPTGTHSLGHTCQVVSELKLQERCPSCHSSQLSLFGGEEQQKHMIAYVFSCSSESERKKWLSVLTRVVKPNLQNERRQEISLNIWIQEAKNVALKKRYFCEIYLDEALHAKTTTKTMTDMLFWGEEFNLCHLEEIKIVTILMWKAPTDNRVKKRKSQQQLICQISIDTKDITDRNSVEKWYPACYSFNSSGAEIFNPNMSQSIISSTDSTSTLQSTQTSLLSHSFASLSNTDHIPMIRIKARYQNTDVLPIIEYSNLIEFLNQNAVQLLLDIDSYLKVKNKEDLANNLINVLHKQGTAVNFLSDLLFHEINKSSDENMILRGNTMASKAIEVYLKLIGEKYLSLILCDFVNRICQGDEDCEVDPEKLKSDNCNGSSMNGSINHSGDKSSLNHLHSILQQRQESLLMNVDMLWAKIMSSSIYFPRDLKSVFITLRTRLEKVKKTNDKYTDSQSNLWERTVSACIFLRFICPAILTPSLFGLIPEYPDNPKVLRTFTLVAKCIQSLANFSDLTGCKESYMMFMNGFIENKFSTMHSFLKKVSTESQEDNNISKSALARSPQSPNENCFYWENLSNTLSEDSIDISLCLAKLHCQFEEYLKIIPAQKFTRNIEILHNLITDINGKLGCDRGFNEHLSLKYSQSYQQINIDKKLSMEISNNKSETENTLTRHSNTKSIVDEAKIYSTSNFKQTKNKSSVIPFSTETSHINYTCNKQPTTSNYIMSQSMIEDNQNYFIAPYPQKISREQVDKEWKEMVSKSSYYDNKITAVSNHLSSSQKFNADNSDSSGYQTMNRSNCAIPKRDDTDSLERLPLSPSIFKHSVKKCKQFKRKPDNSVPTNSTATHKYNIEELILLKEGKMRSYSIDDDSTLIDFMMQSEVSDSGSTETITSKNANESQTNKMFMNTSISMPSFKSSENENELSYFKSKCLRNSEEHIDHGHRMKMFVPLDNTRILTDMRNNSQVIANETEQLKTSLNNIHQNFNARLQQLLLADHKTIELELERVRLMKQICEAADKKMCTTNTPVSLGEQIEFIPQEHVANGLSHTSRFDNSNEISVKKYLDVAENILLNCKNYHQSSQDTNFQKTENLIIQIFETNQYLQNKLLNKLESCVTNSELDNNTSLPFDCSNYDANYSKKLSKELSDTKSNEAKGININSYSKQPLSGRRNSSAASPQPSSSSALIELIDAV